MGVSLHKPHTNFFIFILTAQVAEALESSRIHNNPEALYSMPVKRGQKGQSSQSLRTTMEVRDAMQQVHDLSSDDEMRDTGRVSSSNLEFSLDHSS